MKKYTVFFLALTTLSLFMTSTVTAGDRLPPLGQDVTIWFDTGGPVGGPYNTIVQNGAMQAASDLGAKVTLLYSDWNPEKVVDNFKKSMASGPDGIVLMGLPGDDALAPFIDEAFAKGIIVTCVDTGLPETLKTYKSKGFGFIGTDYVLRCHINPEKFPFSG